MTSERLPNSGVHFNPTPAEDRGTSRDPLIQATTQQQLLLPGVSWIVHYTSCPAEGETKACRAAIVTTEPDAQGRVGLAVFHPTRLEFLPAVPAHHIDENNPDVPRTTEGASGRVPGTWHWPERV